MAKRVAWNKGISCPIETRKKISLNRKGKGLGNQNGVISGLNTRFKKGHKPSEESLKKKSECSKGKHFSPNTEFKKGMISPVKGKKFPERSGKNNPRWSRVQLNCKECGKEFEVQKNCSKTAQFCSKKCAYKYRNKGLTPENIRIRRSVEFRLWRESVFARDGWACQRCGVKGGELHPHHIKNFAEYVELRFAIDNGTTFCKSCHKLFHKIYGVKHNNMEQIVDFIKMGIGGAK